MLGSLVGGDRPECFQRAPNTFIFVFDGRRFEVCHNTLRLVRPHHPFARGFKSWCCYLFFLSTTDTLEASLDKHTFGGLRGCFSFLLSLRKSL